jgi:predicted helicase
MWTSLRRTVLARLRSGTFGSSTDEIGAALMRLRIEYEKQAEYPLERRETGKLDWRVEKMALSKDKSQLRYNEFLTLSGIPAEAYEYRLGNRSALEWVVDQYRVSTDKRSGIQERSEPGGRSRVYCAAGGAGGDGFGGDGKAGWGAGGVGD